MFSQHVTKQLSAYIHGELLPDHARQVAEHLIGCHHCRANLEEMKLGAKLAEHLPQLPGPDSLWLDLEAQVKDLVPKAGPRFFLRQWRQPLIAVAATVILALSLGTLWLYSRETRPFWEVARLDGVPRIGSARVTKRGQLAVGQWLETDNSSRAQIDVGSIGQVDIDPNTRVRLVETRPTEHRLELARGKMSARIWAPPRLFFVDTPSAVAADLGCAYTLEVDENGASLLHVTSGWVALELRGRESMVPAGATCATRPGVGPGSPYFADASETFRKALAKLDFEHEDANWSKIPALDLVLVEARPRDSLTLWHLLARVEGNRRAQVYERLAALVPPPDSVTREGVLQLNEPMLQLWKDKMENTWSDQSRLRKTWLQIWARALGKAQGLEGKK